MGYPPFIQLNAGAKDEIATAAVRSKGVEPRARTIEARDGESLASITMRAYGVNTAANRDRIRSANSTLTGTLRIPY